MNEPVNRRHTLQFFFKRVRFLFAIPLAQLVSLWLPTPLAQAVSERPKGKAMNQNTSPGTLDPFRLPRHVVPIRYDIRLEPDLTAASFAGQETITLTVHQPTSEIVLNAIDLDVTSAQIEGNSGPARQATIA
jgi:puromycin-sensitive aminopeptidase